MPKTLPESLVESATFFTRDSAESATFFKWDSVESWNPGNLESRNPGILETWNPGIPESWKPRIRNPGIPETEAQNPGILWLLLFVSGELPNYLYFGTKRLNPWENWDVWLRQGTLETARLPSFSLRGLASRTSCLKESWGGKLISKKKPCRRNYRKYQNLAKKS